MAAYMMGRKNEMALATHRVKLRQLELALIPAGGLTTTNQYINAYPQILISDPPLRNSLIEKGSGSASPRS